MLFTSWYKIFCETPRKENHLAVGVKGHVELDLVSMRSEESCHISILHLTEGSGSTENF